MRPHDACKHRQQREPCLTFAALAWAKLQFFCHLGNTEIAGFGITAFNKPLYVENFVTVRQHASAMSVKMDDHAVADFTDRCVDAGLVPQQFLRIWCHTHPGDSPEPSGTDEDTFARVFGHCDWAVMFILSRTTNTYARLSFHAGPGMQMQLPVCVDWSDWPTAITDPKKPLSNRLAEWACEFAENVQPFSDLLRPPPCLIGSLPAIEESLKMDAEYRQWTDLEQELWEDYERHERFIHDNRQP